MIFSNYQRFSILKKIKLSDTIVFIVPRFLFAISVIFLLIGLLTNVPENILFSWDIWSLINNFYKLLFLL
jgi:hypothetical protein